VRKISPREVCVRSKHRENLPLAAAAASPTASNGAAEANRLHRFVRFASRNVRRSAFSGRSPQKNFALVNPLLRMLSQLRKRADAGLRAARARAKSKRRRVTKTRNSSALLQRVKRNRECARD